MFADNQGTRIYFEVHGTGAPLVLQHGLSDSVESWHELGYVDLLKRHHRLLLIDARGHGRSDKPRDPESYRLERCAADVVAVLDALAIRRASFYGYSMGGRIGFTLLRHAPERLESLVIGGAVPYARSMKMYRDLFAIGLSAWIDMCERKAGTRLSPTVRGRLESNDINALRALVAHDTPEIFEAPPKLEQRCRLLVGDTDSLAPLVERFASESGAPLHSLAGSNHFQVMDKADAVTRIVLGQ